MLTVWSVALF